MNFKKCNRIAVLFVALTLFAFGQTKAQALLNSAGALQIGPINPACTPAGGMFQWTGTDYQVYDPSIPGWTNLLTGTGGSGLWSTNGNGIHYNAASPIDNVGIGLSLPTSKLHVSDVLTIDGESAQKIDFQHLGNSNTVYGLHIESTQKTNKGTQLGAVVNTSASFGGNTGQATGTLSHTKSFSADGGFNGVIGSVSSTSLSAISSGTTTLRGGAFGLSSTTNVTLGSTGTFWVAGVEGTLNGTINNTPTNGAVAAVLGRDLSTGTAQSWAGYFEGRGHFSDNVGIGTSNPLSKLSVGGDGNALHTGYFESDGNTHGQVAIQASIPSPTASGGDHLRGVYGYVESGTTWSYGVTGSSTRTTPSSSGRAYGVQGLAGNATNGYNYSVLGRLTGSNDGAAIVGVDGDLHAFEGGINGKWAGYFWGNSHFSDKVIIGSTNIPTTAGAINVSNYHLFVKGGILTEEMTIDLCTNWADYVFEDDYDLKSLAEVEAIIKEKGHLHNSPSAKNIEENGLQVGDMMVNQQEKIEELFLHLIEMKKDMDALKAENVALKAEVNTLKE